MSIPKAIGARRVIYSLHHKWEGNHAKVSQSRLVTIGQLCMGFMQRSCSQWARWARWTQWAPGIKVKLVGHAAGPMSKRLKLDAADMEDIHRSLVTARTYTYMLSLCPLRQNPLQKPCPDRCGSHPKPPHLLVLACPPSPTTLTP